MVEYIVKMEKPYDIGKALYYLNVPFVEIRRTESSWHTGTPKEVGWYLCKLKAVDLYETHFFSGNNWGEYVEKWRKIED